MTTDHARTIPIFWGHGKEDPLVKYELAIASRQLLENEFGVKEATEDNMNGLEFHVSLGTASEANHHTHRRTSLICMQGGKHVFTCNQNTIQLSITIL